VFLTGPAVDPKAQRGAREIEVARLSRLFASTNIRELPAPTLPPVAVSDGAMAPGLVLQHSTDEGAR
jgi:type IV secretion system protein TrbI